jgi:hypothetical protein
MEFIVILGFILLLTSYFIISLFNTTDINYSIHSIKNKTLQLISNSNEEIVIPKLDYSVIDSNLNVVVNLSKINTNEEPITDMDYNRIVIDLVKRTKFDNVIIEINYLN